jgi:DNA-binding response OmpR family regulator
MSYPKLIVTISRDESLQFTRTALLHQIGYSVIALQSDTDVLKFLATPGLPFVNLMLMCHTVPEASRVALCKALKAKRPESPILMLYNGYDPTLAEVDGRLENMHSPEAFLDVVELLISNREKPSLDGRPPSD